jgi:hypothetical protein
MNPFIRDMNLIEAVASDFALKVSEKFQRNHSRISCSYWPEYFEVMGKLVDVVLRYPVEREIDCDVPVLEPGDHPILSKELQELLPAFDGHTRHQLEWKVSAIFLQKGLDMLALSRLKPGMDRGERTSMFYQTLNGDTSGRKVQKILGFAMQRALLDQHLRLHLSGKLGYSDDLVECQQRHKVDTIDGWKIEIFSDEHPPAHFHVTGPGTRFSVSIVSCELVDGKPREKDFAVIKRWYSVPGNKQRLIGIWNNTRPDGCMVGKLCAD